MKCKTRVTTSFLVGAIGMAFFPQTGAAASGTAVKRHPLYSIEIGATIDSAGTVELLGSANLPDGSIITTSTSRVFLEDGATDTQAAHSGGGQAVVRNGRFSAHIATDEKNLLIGINTSDPLNRATIAEVSNALTVCAEFATGRNLKGRQNQPDPKVRRAVGASGEQLSGSPNATVFGSLTKHPATYLAVQTSVPFASPLLDRLSQLQGKPVVTLPLAGFCA
jgi:hypothetical protein